MKIESNKNWTTCLRLNTGDGSPRVFLLNSHFLGSVPLAFYHFILNYREATSTLTPGPKVVVTATLRTY